MPALDVRSILYSEALIRGLAWRRGTAVAAVRGPGTRAPGDGDSDAGQRWPSRWRYYGPGIRMRARGAVQRDEASAQMLSKLQGCRTRLHAESSLQTWRYSGPVTEASGETARGSMSSYQRG